MVWPAGLSLLWMLRSNLHRWLVQSRWKENVDKSELTSHRPFRMHHMSKIQGIHVLAVSIIYKKGSQDPNWRQSINRSMICRWTWTDLKNVWWKCTPRHPDWHNKKPWRVASDPYQKYLQLGNQVADATAKLSYKPWHEHVQRNVRFHQRKSCTSHKGVGADIWLPLCYCHCLCKPCKTLVPKMIKIPVHWLKSLPCIMMMCWIQTIWSASMAKV